MGTSDDHRVDAISRQLKVMLPPSSFSSPKPRISHELARPLEGTALVVSPFKSKVCHVEVGRDGDGVFLGRGWPEFVAAQGIGVDWFVVLRHEHGDVLTFKDLKILKQLRLAGLDKEICDAEQELKYVNEQIRKSEISLEEKKKLSSSTYQGLSDEKGLPRSTLVRFTLGRSVPLSADAKMGTVKLIAGQIKKSFNLNIEKKQLICTEYEQAYPIMLPWPPSMQYWWRDMMIVIESLYVDQ
ncbi:hypothetical protein PR202_ga16137 [Eleusine coracana subsp. coracana]|uniref:TF-B3 domain-containing protein n=1 Tax=Eleusine coracana subsp. coracana TaxID=191504 RepID=A0AAV5CLV8_ELECO|nr:hypothetical protein PR202_ga16137 [Eleusine coracana subsp. coracana]